MKTMKIKICNSNINYNNTYTYICMYMRCTLNEYICLYVGNIEMQYQAREYINKRMTIMTAYNHTKKIPFNILHTQ